jgi:Neuraminidase (sialidase)
VGPQLNAAISCAVVLLWVAMPVSIADDKAHAGHKNAAKTALGVVSLDVYAESPSRLHLLTGERLVAGQPPVLRYARSDDGGETWSAPMPVGEGQPTPDAVKRGNDAQIVASGDRLLAVWTTGAATKMGRGPLAASVSRDGGRTWTPGASPSDAAGVIDHAFTDLAADESGTFHAVWLDARGGEGSGKGLRYARSGDGGSTWSKNATLDSQCCECCWNSLLVGPGGRIEVLYRDRDPRDMVLIRSTDSGQTWTRPIIVGAFGWNVTACPHVGGALAATDRERKNLAAVVWTAKGDGVLGVFALTSSDAGQTWSDPTKLGGPQASRPDIVADANRVVAVWDEYLDTPEVSGNVPFAAVSSDQGRNWSEPRRLGGAGASHPRLVATSDGFRVFWTEQSAGKPVRWMSCTID